MHPHILHSTCRGHPKGYHEDNACKGIDSLPLEKPFTGSSIIKLECHLNA